MMEQPLLGIQKKKKKNNCQKSLNKKIKGKSIRVSRIFVSLEEKQIDLFKKNKKKTETWEQPQLNWKTAFEQAGEAQEWQIASACSKEFPGSLNGCPAQPQAGLSGRISAIVWSGWPGWSRPGCFCSLGSLSTNKWGPGVRGACGAQELGVK